MIPTSFNAWVPSELLRLQGDFIHEARRDIFNANSTFGKMYIKSVTYLLSRRTPSLAATSSSKSSFVWPTTLDFCAEVDFRSGKNILNDA